MKQKDEDKIYNIIVITWLFILLSFAFIVPSCNKITQNAESNQSDTIKVDTLK